MPTFKQKPLTFEAVLDSYILEKVVSYKEELKSNIDRVFQDFSQHSTSPIEKLMLIFLIKGHWDYWSFGTESQTDIFFSYWEASPHAMEVGCQQSEALCIAYQYPFLKYKLDFAIFAPIGNRQSLKIAIECDGHDFHERTKEQASRDRRRDRMLQRHGWIVFRFTGSDIYNRGRECVEEITDYIYQRASGRSQDEVV